MPINKTICPKCADDSLTVDNNKINCCYCTTPMIITELTTAEFRTDEPKYTKLIFDEYVKDNPLYDPKMHNQRFSE